MSRQWSLGLLLVTSFLGWSGASVCYKPYSCVAALNCKLRGEGSNHRLTEGFECAVGEVCCEKENSSQSAKTPTFANNCGYSNPDGLEKSTDHLEGHSKPAEFPWTVAVYVKDQLIGGGSLVAPGVVLTAAHILNNVTAADVRIISGDWNLASEDESFDSEEQSVTLIKKHENFTYATGVNNLALVFLNEPFQLKDHIRKICLPSSQTRSYLKTKCKVVGWGVQNFGDRYFSDIQKVVDLALVDRDQCQDQLRQTTLGEDFKLDTSLICAGGEEGIDACIGDGGSAIFCQLRGSRSRYVQVGIVNWGMKCGQKDVPAVYTNVSMFYEWIDQQIKSIPIPQRGQYRTL